METTIDAGGRVVIPKRLRERLGLGPGSKVRLTDGGGKIEIEPVAAAMTLERRRGRLVAVASEDLPPLTDELIRTTLENERR